MMFSPTRQRGDARGTKSRHDLIVEARRLGLKIKREGRNHRVGHKLLDTKQLRFMVQHLKERDTT